MRGFLRENSLGLLFIGLCLAAMAGDALTGHALYNEDAAAHGEATISLWRYLASSTYAQAITENWESEFLQFATFFVAAIWLFQRGSSESKEEDKLGLETDADQKVGSAATARSPLWAKMGGLRTTLYSWSLVIAMTILFLGSWLAQSLSQWRVYNAEQLQHDQAPVGWLGYLGRPDFWEATFQNWQSEFLAVATIALFSVYLRQRGSDESKKVGEPHAKTGTG